MPGRRGRCRSRASARRSRQRCAHELGGCSVPAAVADLGEEARPEEDAVQEHGHEELLDVLGRDVAARVQHGPRARRAVERERAADGAADRDDVELAGRADEVDDPARDGLVHEHVADGARGASATSSRSIAGSSRPSGWPPSCSSTICASSSASGIAERRLHEEAVELRLGQRERALVLDRVLGRDDEERVVEPARLAVDRHLLLGHRLEQRGLRLRHRAVDLVDEHDVREDRARAGTRSRVRAG